MEFQLDNYKLRLLEDGTTIERWYEYKNGKQFWKELKFRPSNKNYLFKTFRFSFGERGVSKHRLIYYAHNQDWDIWDSSKDNQIDHTNRDRHDNKIENLSVVNQQQNNHNTGAKGYTWDKRRKRYVVYITNNTGKQIKIKRVKTEEEAIEVRKQAEKDYWGKV